MKYLYLQMQEVLAEARNPQGGVTVANLTSSLRAAGYDVLVRLPLPPGPSPQVEKERFAVLEGLADMFYNDLQLPTRSMQLRSLYGLRIGLFESKVHLPFAAKMMRNNPLTTHVGFQLFPTDQTIRNYCDGGYCPHAVVMWNHVYISLMVLSQLMERIDTVAELLVADSISHVTGQERSNTASQQVSILLNPRLSRAVSNF